MPVLWRKGRGGKINGFDHRPRIRASDGFTLNAEPIALRVLNAQSGLSPALEGDYMAGKHARKKNEKPSPKTHSVADAEQGSFKAAFDYDSSSTPRAAAQAYARDAAQYSTRRKMSRGKRIALGVFIALVVVLAGVGMAVALYVNSINATLAGNKTDQEIAEINEALAPVKSNLTEPFYVMLVGSDEREDNDEIGRRSDTNIVVRVDPKTNTVSMVSIPRDTAINLSEYGTVKFNAAYTFGDTAGSIKQASEMLGVDISYYAEINFTGLIGLVDAVGGVDVDVDERIDDPDAGPVVIEAGRQHLDGEAALVFARSRAYADGDYTRVSNQRKLIQAIVTKIEGLPVTEMPGMIQAAAKCVTTNLKVTDIIGLAQAIKDNGDMTIYSATVPSLPAQYNGASYVFADYDAIKKMMAAVDAGLDPSTVTTEKTPEMLMAEYQQRVAGASTRSGTTVSPSSGYSSNTYSNSNQYSGQTYGNGTGNGGYANTGSNGNGSYGTSS